MTCIVGIETRDGVIIGGDSLASSNWDCYRESGPKVFKKGPLVMGCTTSFRMSQLLQYKWEIPDQLDIGDMAYLCGPFIDSIRECFAANGFTKIESNQETGGVFLLGFKGNLYTVFDDFNVSRPACGYAAVGCGNAYALGSLHSLESIKSSGHIDMTPLSRLTMALSAAAEFSNGVREPFHFEWS